LRTRFSLLELIIAVFLIGLLMAIIIPTLQTRRESSRRISCASNLCAISRAMFMYADVPANNNYFPNTGTKADPFDAKPMDSLGLLYDKYVMDPRCFSCPSTPVPPEKLSAWKVHGPAETSYGFDPGRGYNNNDAVLEFLSDQPSAAENSDNHGPNAGQNVVTGDGMVSFIATAVRKKSDGKPDDNIYQRDTALPRSQDAYIRK
jgi:Tfp pilus assembly protein PilE